MGVIRRVECHVSRRMVNMKDDMSKNGVKTEMMADRSGILIGPLI